MRGNVRHWDCAARSIARLPKWKTHEKNSDSKPSNDFGDTSREPQTNNKAFSV